MKFKQSIYNNFTSIIPTEMSNRDLQKMCTELYIAKMKGRKFATIMLPNGLYNNPIKRLKNYQDAFQTECGALTMNRQR
jgi:hypothetical protein